MKTAGFGQMLLSRFARVFQKPTDFPDFFSVDGILISSSSIIYRPRMVWQVGDNMTVEEGAAAARLIGLNMLATLKRE